MLMIAGLLVTLAVTVAPADEYFGKLKMSALRVRYETMQLKKRYETHQLLPEQAEHLLLLTQNSFDQWAVRYPQDPWLASTGFLIAALYAELPGTAAREHAVTLYVLVKSHFPNSSYAASSRFAGGLALRFAGGLATRLARSRAGGAIRLAFGVAQSTGRKRLRSLSSR
jgi:hypothetical protein